MLVYQGYTREWILAYREELRPKNGHQNTHHLSGNESDIAKF